MSADTVRVSYPVDALVSYHYFRDEEKMARLVNTERLRLIGDSGAFSAHTQGATVDLVEYASWARRWLPNLLWVASLDVIGEPEVSYRNWRALRDEHGLMAVPTVHAGANPSWLDAYASTGATLVGLGGLVGVAPRAFRWAVYLFRYSRSRWPDVRFHLWGTTSRQYLDSLPAWSADSSSVLMAPYAFATVRVFDPGTGKHHSIALRGRAAHQHAALLRKTYGVDPADMATSHSGNRDILVRLAIASTQQYARWLQNRHKVHPPAALPVDIGLGPRVHAVAGCYQTDMILPALTGAPAASDWQP